MYVGDTLHCSSLPWINVCGRHTSLLQRWVCLECINTYFSYQEKNKSLIPFQAHWSFLWTEGKLAECLLCPSANQENVTINVHELPLLGISAFFYFCPRELYLTVLCHTLCLLVLSFSSSEKTFKLSAIAHIKIHYFLQEKPLTNSYTGVGSFICHNYNHN